jgi:multiple sugar transport system permease protein
MIVFAWQQLGFNTVLFLAGMQGIDRSLYEAADIDGANAWNRFRSITVPLLKPTTVFVVTNATILALQLFNEPFILQAPSPPNGPNNSTLSPVIYLYQNAFQRFRQGYASAVAWALFLLIFAITLIYFSRQDEDGVLSA